MSTWIAIHHWTITERSSCTCLYLRKGGVSRSDIISFDISTTQDHLVPDQVQIMTLKGWNSVKMKIFKDLRPSPDQALEERTPSQDRNLREQRPMLDRDIYKLTPGPDLDYKESRWSQDKDSKQLRPFQDQVYEGLRQSHFRDFNKLTTSYE